jgi:hypothetical protein
VINSLLRLQFHSRASIAIQLQICHSTYEGVWNCNLEKWCDFPTYLHLVVGIGLWSTYVLVRLTTFIATNFSLHHLLCRRTIV